MADTEERKWELWLLWGAAAACLIALAAGAGTHFWPGRAALVIFGGCAATLAVFGHGWHRAQSGLGTLARSVILLVLVWAPMVAIGWWKWPLPEQVPAPATANTPSVSSSSPQAPEQTQELPNNSNRHPQLTQHPLQPANPSILPGPPSNDPLIEQALTAMQHCSVFQQQAEERRNAALENVKSYDANPAESAESKKQYKLQMEKNVMQEDQAEYTQNYKREFTQVIHALIAAGAREQSPDLDYQNAGYVGAPANFCDDLRGTAWSYVDTQFHRKRIPAAGVRQFIARLRRIERMYPAPPPPVPQQ